MLTEVRNVRQVPGEGFRRCFLDERMDLTIWYQSPGSLFGFQLSCATERETRVLTWTSARGFTHALLDDGEDKPTVNRTPILWPAPLGDVAPFREAYLAASGGLPEAERTFISTRLAELSLET